VSHGGQPERSLNLPLLRLKESLLRNALSPCVPWAAGIAKKSFPPSAGDDRGLAGGFLTLGRDFSPRAKNKEGFLPDRGILVYLEPD